MNTYNSLDNSMDKYPEYPEYREYHGYGNNTNNGNYLYIDNNIFPILFVATTFLCSLFVMKGMIKWRNHVYEHRINEEWANIRSRPARRRRRNRIRTVNDMTQHINEYNINGDSENPEDIVDIDWIKVTDKEVIAKIADAGIPCCICLESIKPDEDMGQLPCEHIYHYNCIEEWLMKTEYEQSCPLCKAPICQDIQDIQDIEV
jgi:hypothetical protein